jgi:hypothetical protein
VSLEYVNIRKAFETVSRMQTGQVGASQRSPSLPVQIQAVQESWKGPGIRHASGVWGSNPHSLALCSQV